MAKAKGKNEYIIAVLTKALMVLIGLVESMLLARYLGAELRGQVGYINSITQTAYIIATIGIYTAYPYYRKSTDDKQGLTDRVMSVTVVMFGFYMIICAIAAFFLRGNMEWFYIAILIPGLFYDKMISFVWMIEEPNKRNGVVLIAAFVKMLYYGGLYLWAPKTLFWGVTTIILAPALESVYFTFKLKFKFSFKYMKKDSFWGLVSYGFLPMVAVLLTTLNYRIDIIMLRRFEIITLADLGIYTIGITLAEKVLLVSDAVKEILLSKLAKGKGEEEVAKVMRFCFLVSFLMAICVSVISKWFIGFFYGAEYAGGELVTNISVWGTIFMVFFKMISQYNVANHRQKYNVIFLTVAILLNIGMNMLFIPTMGINGAALATAIGYCISSMMFVIYFHKLSGIKYVDLIFIKKSDITSTIEKVKNMFGKSKKN